MILAFPNKPVWFTPPWLRDQPNPPAFALRAGSIIDRDMFEARLDGEFGARVIYDFQEKAIIKEGIAALAPEGDRDELIALVETHYSSDPESQLSDVERARFQEVLDIMAQHWPDYRACRTQAARRENILPTLAFMTFCVDWRNVQSVRTGEIVPFAKNAQGEIEPELLIEIPGLMLKAAGQEAYRMLWGQAERKNSVPPLKSPPDPAISSSGGDTGTDG